MIDTQLHGYRQGHQLLAASAPLPKADQAVVDRLSDVAGPLRPGETFEPYLSVYPLPGHAHVVVARTWQDATVPRAGCVRTLSLLVPTPTWATARALRPFLDLLDPGTFPTTAERFGVPGVPGGRIPSLPPVPEFLGIELLEALFLEGEAPVAVFDAALPELVAERLLTALWPSLRGRFALSTFALSPRKVQGRSFDLVFAPKDARPRFADWSGRRVEGRGKAAARHRWTDVLVERVFGDPEPSLLTEREIGSLLDDDGSPSSILRVALRWEELRGDLDSHPSAALGLLDLANTRMQGDGSTLASLGPALEDAARRAIVVLPPSEAWDFLGAMSRKLKGTSLASSSRSVSAAAARLAAGAPSGAIELLEQPDPNDAVHVLVPGIAEGLGDGFSARTAEALAAAGSSTLARLLSADGRLCRKVLAEPALVRRLSTAIPELDGAILVALRDAILPLIVEDAQLPVAWPLLASLDADSLVSEARHLSLVNGLSAYGLNAALANRARDIGAVEQLRDAIADLPETPGRDLLISATLSATPRDVSWILDEPRLTGATVDALLVTLLWEASVDQFPGLFGPDAPVAAILRRIPDNASDVLLRALREGDLAVTDYVTTTIKLLVVESVRDRIELARLALDRALPVTLEGDGVSMLTTLLAFMGGEVDGRWVAWRGLETRVGADLVGRNLLAFAASPDTARQRIVEAADVMVQALAGRWEVNLKERAAEACAGLLLDALARDRTTLRQSMGRLLPPLLRSGRAPVSALVAACFPVVYQELANGSDTLDLSWFMPFFDWDRCKPARHEIVNAFLASPAWKPSDLALLACRSSEVDRILRRVAKMQSGMNYLDRLSADLWVLPDPCRSSTASVIARIGAGED